MLLIESLHMTSHPPFCMSLNNIKNIGYADVPDHAILYIAAVFIGKNALYRWFDNFGHHLIMAGSGIEFDPG